MRREFREPELKRIELRLEERIAESPIETYGQVDIYKTRHQTDGSCFLYMMRATPEVKVDDYRTGDLTPDVVYQIYQNCLLIGDTGTGAQAAFTSYKNMY